MSWKRKDNRVVRYVITADAPVAVDLQATGTEPIIMTVTNNDVQMAYASERDYPITFQDGVTITWDTQNPFNTQFYLSVTGTDSYVTFLIGGSSNAR